MTKDVNLNLSNKKCLEIFHNALCNGLSYISSYGIGVDADRVAYNEARAKLESPCIEDIYLQILKDGGVLKFVDCEGDESVDVDLSMVLKRVPQVELDTLMDVIQEQDDAETADIILQTVIYGEVQFG